MFHRAPRSAVALVVLVLAASGLAVSGCSDSASDAAAPGEPIGGARSSLTAAERRARAAIIRDAAAARGLEQGWLLAGIADAETGMSQCWSELTWACEGPASPDCGGGPVVAGAGDGACPLQQGGLGMFQFDAGTYADTLAREGDRILTISGNTDAAVDFVIAMVIRSVYITGVDTADQALAWMNTVRVDNAQFDPWIKTVTHYYNGCTPTGCSVYDARYASYAAHATDTYNEMGATFWATRVDYAATFVSQTFPYASVPFELGPGAEQTGTIELRNAGAATWEPGVTLLGTTEPRDGASALAGPDWLSPSRAASVDRVVPPGETGLFTFTVRAPTVAGDYPQYFNLVQEGVAWFSEQGGPPDTQLQVRVTVTSTLVPPDAGAPIDPRPRSGDVGGCSAGGRGAHGASVLLWMFGLALVGLRRRGRR
jgi:hypothetical protein